MLVLDPELRIKAATPSFYRRFRLNPESVRDRPVHRMNHLVADNPELQKALEKVQKTSDEIAPFTMELKRDGQRQKFECRVDRITLDGGAKVITLSMHPPKGEDTHTQTKA